MHTKPFDSLMRANPEISPDGILDLLQACV
jgi:hypothetical protein